MSVQKKKFKPNKCTVQSLEQLSLQPQNVKDIQMLERIQRRATKYILNDCSMDYISRLTSRHLLPISLWLDLHDLFLVKCLQDPGDNIEINRFITFRCTCTRAGSTGDQMLTINLVHTSTARHFYFNRITMLWNVVQSSTNLSITESVFTVKRRLLTFLWAHFNSHFDPLNSCTYHIVCPCSNCHSAVRF